MPVTSAREGSDQMRPHSSLGSRPPAPEAILVPGFAGPASEKEMAKHHLELPDATPDPATGSVIITPLHQYVNS